jgi:lysophospholipase L1-like esterase
VNRFQILATLSAVLAGCGSKSAEPPPSAGGRPSGGEPTMTSGAASGARAGNGVGGSAGTNATTQGGSGTGAQGARSGEGATTGGAANGGIPSAGTANGEPVGGTSSSEAGGSAGMPAQGGTSGAAGRASGSAGSAGRSTVGAGGSGGAGTITLWLAGDSTMADGETPCPVGWGKEFASYFDAGVSVKNSAVGGASIRTWLYDVTDTMDQSGECVLQEDASGNPTVQARWTQMLAGMKTGDYLFVQFGINDGDSTCDRHVGIDAFEESLGVMAQAAKDRGTQPIFLTPVSAIACTGSTAKGTRGAYVTATLDAGTQFDVPVIELHALSVALYNSLGFCPIPGGDVSADTTGPVGDFFCNDHTHFEASGATQIAGLVAKALSDQGIAVSTHLK